MSRLADDVLPEIQAYIEGLKRGEDVTAAPRRKSPIPGPLASSRQPAFTTPGVPEALRWLLNPKAQTSLPIVRRRAAMNGLLHNRSNIHWSVDGPSIRRLTQRAISRIPSDPEELAIILHGLGECAARCHADLLGAFLTKLNRRDPADCHPSKCIPDQQVLPAPDRAWQPCSGASAIIGKADLGHASIRNRGHWESASGRRGRQVRICLSREALCTRAPDRPRSLAPIT